MLDQMMLLRFGLSGDTIRLIGQGALLWNTAEIELVDMIGAIVDWPVAVGRVVTVDLQNVSRIQLALNLLALSGVDPNVAGHTRAVLDLFDQLRVTRNAIIHGIPALHMDRPKESGIVVKVEAKQGDGTLKVKETKLTASFVGDFVNAAEILLVAIPHTTELLRRDHKYRRSKSLRKTKSHAQFVWQGAGRGPEEPALRRDRKSVV